MLMVGDRPVAWNYGFQFHGSWFWYQPTFDSRQEENSPGQCLLLRIVTEACDMDGIKVVDLGLGAEGYKDRFGNQYATDARRYHDEILEPPPARNREISRGQRIETVAEG